MKTLSAIIAALPLVIVTLGLIAGCGRKPEEVVRPFTIVLFGDSITTGYGVDDGESYAGLVTKIMGADIYGNISTVNAGMNGDDSAEALKRIERDVLAHKPDIVVIQFGLNDSQNNLVDIGAFRSNISFMVSRLPVGCTPVLMTSNTFLDVGDADWKKRNDSLDAYMNVLREISREKSLPLVDVHDAWEDMLRRDSRHIEALYIDSVHPSPSGHRLIYETIMNVLRRLLVR
jgi:lysophospholipase L1-like esterase